MKEKIRFKEKKEIKGEAVKTIFVIIAGVIVLLLGSSNLLSATEESFQFSPGANLFAYPVDPGSAYSVADLLTNMNNQGEVSSIQHFNSESGLFETCVWKNNSAAGANFPILAEEGYIVHAPATFTYLVYGDRICPKVPLDAGLNIVAFPCAASGYDAYQLLQDLGSAAIAVKTENPADSSIFTATRQNNVIDGDNFSIEHGHSYLIYMETETSWYPVAPPLAPGNVTGYAGDQLAILTWTPPVGNIIGYNIYRSNSSGSNYEKLNSNLLQSTTYTDQGLNNEIVLYYVVSAVDQYDRETAFSTEAAVTPANTGPTTIPAGSTITTNTTWSLSGSPYSISDSITVAAGATLTLESGVVVEFHTGRFNIDGRLIAKGTADHPIVFRADDGSWTGLRFIGAGSSNSILEHCRVENASTPIYIEDSDPEISHCEILGTSSQGIQLLRSNAHIHHTNISGSYSSMVGLYLTNSSPLIEFNTITSLRAGIYMYGDCRPQILHNTITNFTYWGLDLVGSSTNQPYPTITDNSIETSRGGSSTYLIRTQNYYNNPAAGIHRTVNANNNYWGTTDPQILTASIAQWVGTGDEPYVDFSVFLDGPNGNIVPGHFVSSGPLPADELSWIPAEGPYIVLGHALVDSGDELVIAPGTEIQFAGGGDVYGYGRNRFSSLQVLGKLTAVGTTELSIHLFSESDIPEKSDWLGIVFMAGYDNSSVVSYCRIEHAHQGIRCYGGSTAINNNEILAGSVSGESWAAGIRLHDGNTSTINNNSISGYSYSENSGIYAHNSSPTITGNTITENMNGVYIGVDSYTTSAPAPNITSNSILNSTKRSVYLYGIGDDLKNPQPVINNNTIIASSVLSNSFYAYGYGSYGQKSTIIVNAQNNWWGTYDAALIDKAVYDFNDNEYSPLVDYRFFLDNTGGQSGSGNQVLGDLPAGANTWIVADSPYQVMGDLNIPLGTTLTIAAGVEVWMSSGNTVNVNGELIINGTEENPVLFTAGSMTGTPTDWEGIRLIGASNDNSILTYCHIEDAKSPIYIEDCSPTISYCEITAATSTSHTTHLLRSNAYIHHCTISNITGNTLSIRGLYIDHSSPQVEYNEIIGMHTAIDIMSSSNPNILHNVLQNFSYTGIDCDGYYGDSFPVINHNTIQTNRGDSNTWAVRTSYYDNDASNGIYQTIDAKNNYWGTADPQLISGSINQWAAGDSTDPFVDFSGFLDSPGGTPVSGSFISPGILTDLTWQPSSNPYIVLGHTIISEGQTLTIAPGTEIRFLGGSESIFSTSRNIRSSLRIHGKLTASGTSGLPIHFYSNHRNPTEGNWTGIIFYDNSDDTSLISYSKIEHAFNGIYCIEASPEISNNEIIAGPGNAYSSYLYGIWLEDGSNAAVSNNLITGFEHSGNKGITVLDSSPTITGNTIEDNYYGVYVKDGSPSISSNTIAGSYYGLYLQADSNTAASITPSITSNSIIDSTAKSVHIYGSGNDTTSPLPVFSNNSFVTQHSPERSFEATYYSSPSSITLNAENNWWGTTVQTEIEAIIWDHTDYSRSPTINFQSNLTQAIPSSLVYNINLSDQWFSPNGDTNQDSVTLSWQGSADITNWTVTVKNNLDQLVRTKVLDSSMEWIWDGKNDSGVQVEDGQYTLFISGSNTNGSVERDMSVNIDTQPVTTIQINSPTETANLQNVFDIVATVQDGNLDDYILEIGKGSSPGSWRQLETGSVNIDHVTLYTLESNTINTDTIPSLPTVGDLTDGPYTIRLTATDVAGNTSVINRSINLGNIFITNVSVTELVVNLAISQSASVEFTIDKTADVELRIYTESEGEIDQLVRVISQSSPLDAETYIFSWDGKNDSGEYVAVGGYIFVLSATTGSGLTDQFIPDRTLNQPASWTPISSFNAASNDWFTADCTMENVPGHYRVRITPYGESEFNVYTQYYAAHESFLFTWDGRRPDGTLVDVSTTFWIFDTWGNANILIVNSSSAPEVTGQAPNVNVKSDPFLINFCYGEQTSLLYNLDREAKITITLFPVDEDASSSDAIVLVDQETLSAGDHTVTWSGTDDTDIRHVLFAKEGPYTFLIEAEATVGGVTSSSRGILNLYK